MKLCIHCSADRRKLIPSGLSSWVKTTTTICCFGMGSTGPWPTCLLLTSGLCMPANVPPFLVTHFIKLLCGATNYDGGRRRKFAPDGSVHPAKSPANPFPCYLCELGDVCAPGDNERHIFQSCCVVKEAWVDVLLHPKGPRDGEWAHHFASKVSPLFIIDFPLGGKDSGYCRLILLMAFCWAVYKTIGQIRMGRCAQGAGERAAALTISLNNIWLTRKPKAKIKKPG